MASAEHRTEIDGVEVAWRERGDAPLLYLHGVPVSGWQWDPFLARCGGIAPDLPGFGRSGKPGDFDYTIEGYDRFIETRSVDVHVGRLRAKLGPAGEQIETVIGLGYRFNE